MLLRIGLSLELRWDHLLSEFWAKGANIRTPPSNLLHLLTHSLSKLVKVPLWPAFKHNPALAQPTIIFYVSLSAAVSYRTKSANPVKK